MKTFLTIILVVGFVAACCADIQDPPSNDYGPTRKLGRGVTNFVFAWSELPVTMATVNTREGNSAAAGYGVVRGLGRSFVRFGVGFYEMVTAPFPSYHASYTPLLRNDVHYIHAGYAEFPPELGNESKYPYVRQY
jgi:putative exosortase-associated protein (TIGR04073 family)